MKSLNSVHTRSYSTLKKLSNSSHPLKENTHAQNAASHVAKVLSNKRNPKAVPSMKIDISSLATNRKKTTGRNAAARVNKSFALGCSSRGERNISKDMGINLEVSPVKQSMHTKSTTNLIGGGQFETMRKLLSYETEIEKLKKENFELKNMVKLRERESVDAKAMVKKMQEQIEVFVNSFNGVLANMESVLAAKLTPAILPQTSPHSHCSSSLSSSSLVTVFDYNTDTTLESPPSLRSKPVTGYQKFMETAHNKWRKEEELTKIAAQLEEKCKDVERHKQFIRKLKGAIQTLLQENNIAKTLACYPSFVSF